MEIKKGYKMTDVGVIPEDWEVKSIEPHIGKVKSGKRLPLGYFVLPNKNNHPYIRVVDMNMGYVDMSNIMYVPEEAYSAISQYIITKDDIYISVAGTLGLIGKIPPSLDGANLTENANRITDIKCNRDYLMYWLMTEYIQGCIRDSQTLGAQPKLAVYQIRDFLVAIPKSIVEQQAIADALTKVDNLITSLTKVIEKKKLIKKGAMQKLLSGVMRLDGFEGEFATKTFSDFIERFATGLNPRDNFELNKGGNNYYVTIKNFINGKLFLDDNCDKITDEAKDIIDKRSSLKVGDVLFSSIGRIGDAYVINENPTNWNINESVFSLRPNPTIMDSYFLYYLIMSDSVQKKFDDAISGSTLKSIKLNDLREIECTYPQNIDEQTAIANILTTMDNEIEALEKERDKYKCIKQGMMQQLLTGKIRLICQ